mmetsp:Transcript_4376/g.6135  ORF Transcript_4376/g.6135 Transcript_4376/m.6135 type:complete len:178 (-) Transcript_4376:723-1256(-)
MSTNKEAIPTVEHSNILGRIPIVTKKKFKVSNITQKPITLVVYPDPNAMQISNVSVTTDAEASISGLKVGIGISAARVFVNKNMACIVSVTPGNTSSFRMVDSICYLTALVENDDQKTYKLLRANEPVFANDKFTFQNRHIEYPVARSVALVIGTIDTTQITNSQQQNIDNNNQQKQ